MLTVDQAKQAILEGAEILVGKEDIALFDALGRRLAEDVFAGLDVPPQDNSAMDGIALCSGSSSGEGEKTLKISQRIAAGDSPEPLQPGSAARIFTGAEIPPGADAVIIQENCKFTGDSVRFSVCPGKGDNIRPKGQDIARGSLVLTKGQSLGSQEMGLLASIGIGQVPVFKKVRVGVFSTGDELVEPGKPLSRGKIYNSNRYSLAGLIQQCGCEFVDLGQVEDSLPSTIQLLKEAGPKVDLLISSGGVSVGEEDHVKAAVEACGEITLWKIALKPGKPLAMGNVLGTPFFGLPGNPVSGFTTFLLFVKPYLTILGGGSVEPLSWFSVRAGFNRSAPSREEYLRVKLVEGKAELFANQSSGVLSSLSWSSGLVRQQIGQSIEASDSLDYLPFENF